MIQQTLTEALMLLMGIALATLWFMWDAQAAIADPPESALPKVELLQEASIWRVTHSDIPGGVQCLFWYREGLYSAGTFRAIKCPTET